MADSINVLDWATPLSDEEVPSQFQETLAQYRRIHTEVFPRLHEKNRHGDVRVFDFIKRGGHVAYRVKAGSTMKQHGARAEQAYGGWSDSMSWDFDDTPTQDSIVFWIPCLIPGTQRKLNSERLEILGDIREEVGLPEHHLSCFGPASLIALLILIHFQTTQRVHLPSGVYALTDTVIRRRNWDLQMILGGWDGDGAPGIDQTPGLECDGTNPSERGVFWHGCYAHGVELL